MNEICPRCGKDNTQPFRDKKLGTHGFEGLDCHKDFGVDDGKTLEEYENNLTDFFFTHTDKEGFTKQITIHKESDDKVWLKAATIDKNGRRQPYEPRNIASIYPELKTLLFRKLYILDWDKELLGLLLPSGNEKYEIRLSFSLAVLPGKTFTGTNRFPPYFKILPRIFDQFFETEDENAAD